MCRLYQEDMSKQASYPTSEEFVKAWQASESVSQVMSKTGMSKRNVQARAQYLRLKGVHLSNMKRGRAVTINVKALNKLIGGGK